MAGKDQDYRVFVGGLSWDVTERQLQTAFNRYGEVLDCQVMADRETGRPRGFGFLTFADLRSMEDAIREMNGREIGDKMISVNKAKPKIVDEDSDHGGYKGRSYGGGRGSYGGGGGGGDRSGVVGQGECFKCGRPGHWARDCSSGGGAPPPRGGGGRPLTPPRRGGRYGGDRGERFFEDRYDARRDDRERYDDRYAPRDRYPPPSNDRFGGDRYGGGSDRYRDGASRGGGGDRYGGGGERYGGGGGPARYEGGRNYRERPAPYERPKRAAGRAPSFERY